jgi:predicted GNAT family N-acyltransferase
MADFRRKSETFVAHCAFSEAMAIRRAVFVVEQKIDESIEIDAFDENCVHYIATRDGVAVGAARMRAYGAGTVKIERMAVLAEHRGGGVGRALLAQMEADAAKDGAREAVLHAQDHALGFYERCGYRAEGPGFEEAGIPHHKMRKAISTVIPGKGA